MFLWLGDLCGWGLVLTIVIAGLVKRVFEDFFPVECLYGGCFRLFSFSDLLDEFVL